MRFSLYLEHLTPMPIAFKCFRPCRPLLNDEDEESGSRNVTFGSEQRGCFEYPIIRVSWSSIGKWRGEYRFLYWEKSWEPGDSSLAQGNCSASKMGKNGYVGDLAYVLHTQSLIEDAWALAHDRNRGRNIYGHDSRGAGNDSLINRD